MLAVQAVSGTTWTVMRGAEGSVPVAHASGFTVVQVVTAGDLAGLQYRPWEFPVSAYGAEGDGKIGTGRAAAFGRGVPPRAGPRLPPRPPPPAGPRQDHLPNPGHRPPPPPAQPSARHPH